MIGGCLLSERYGSEPCGSTTIGSARTARWAPAACTRGDPRTAQFSRILSLGVATILEAGQGSMATRGSSLAKHAAIFN